MAILLMNKKSFEPIASVALKSCTNLIETKAPQARLRARLELFGAVHEIIIEHAGDEYGLRLTRQGN